MWGLRRGGRGGGGEGRERERDALNADHPCILVTYCLDSHLLLVATSAHEPPFDVGPLSTSTDGLVMTDFEAFFEQHITILGFEGILPFEVFITNRTLE